MTKAMLSEYEIEVAIRDGFRNRLKKIDAKIKQNLKDQADSPSSILLRAEMSRLENQKTITETTQKRLKL